MLPQQRMGAPGAHGEEDVALGAARGRGSVSLYRTDSDDDILFVSSSAFGRGFCQNAGRTRRQGVEVDLEGGLPVLSWLQFDWFASYAFIDRNNFSPLLRTFD